MSEFNLSLVSDKYLICWISEIPIKHVYTGYWSVLCISEISIWVSGILVKNKWVPLPEIKLIYLLLLVFTAQLLAL